MPFVIAPTCQFHADPPPPALPRQYAFGGRVFVRRGGDPRRPWDPLRRPRFVLRWRRRHGPADETRDAFLARWRREAELDPGRWWADILDGLRACGPGPEGDRAAVDRFTPAVTVLVPLAPAPLRDEIQVVAAADHRVESVVIAAGALSRP